MTILNESVVLKGEQFPTAIKEIRVIVIQISTVKLSVVRKAAASSHVQKHRARLGLCH